VVATPAKELLGPGSVGSPGSKTRLGKRDGAPQVTGKRASEVSRTEPWRDTSLRTSLSEAVGDLVEEVAFVGEKHR